MIADMWVELILLAVVVSSVAGGVLLCWGLWKDE